MEARREEGAGHGEGEAEGLKCPFIFVSPLPGMVPSVYITGNK